MLSPLKVVDLELSQPLVTLNGLDNYRMLQGLVRLHGVPLGVIQVPIINGQCTANTLTQKIVDELHWPILRHLVSNGLENAHLFHPSQPIDLEHLWSVQPAMAPLEGNVWPSVTVAVCTRDRPQDLQLCLDALCQLEYPHLEILVVDNAPSSEATQAVVANYAQVRYVCEPRPGLDWARNRAILAATGEIIAYTDDDVVVDRGWVRAIAAVFAQQPDVMAITGLVVPYELETDAQVLFEMAGGFGKGFEPRWYRVPAGETIPWYLLGTGNFGTGANMAYRRSLFDQVGGFDPALDVGTPTNGAGDLEMFFRVIKAGHTLVYLPQALVRHRHRRDYVKLKSQLFHHGSAFSYFVAAVHRHPEEAVSFVRLGLSWMWRWHLRRLWAALVHPTQFPRDLVWAEFWGCWVGLTRYFASARLAQKRLVQDEDASDRAALQALMPRRIVPRLPQPSPRPDGAVAVRSLELSETIPPLLDVSDYDQVRVFVSWQGDVLGSVDVANARYPVSRMQLIQMIMTHLGYKLLQTNRQMSAEAQWAEAVASVNRRLIPENVSQPIAPLPDQVPVSILVATCDRPDDLRCCLQSLRAQISPRPVEIIVIDNRPTSGLTPPVVAEFPGVILVKEPRTGVAYARNAGIAASTGDIIVTIDDDVITPPDWLEKLLTPFTRADVMAVTGNILPAELEEISQRFFEQYGGLGRGFYSFEVGHEWFERSWKHVVPTWELGGTANSAYRASVFNAPDIGLMDEALGPGMPSGVGEDIYLFYRILKAGYTIIYESSASVWHQHRRTMAALRRQLYNYSKGFVSYNLTTWLVDGDWRVLLNLGFYLPLHHLKRIYLRLRGRSDYPIALTLVEIAGNLAGPWSLWRSRVRVAQGGRSQVYVPPSQRVTARSTAPRLAGKGAANHETGKPEEREWTLSSQPVDSQV